jgi:RND family efflux transporter MFP subunit
MKRRYKIIPAAIGVIIFLVLMFLWLTGNLSRGSKIGPGKSPVSEASAAGMKTMKVETATVPLTLESVGTVDARVKSEVSSKILAKIARVGADAGDIVEKGQMLFILDSRDATARLDQARQALASAEAEFERASLDAGRMERLLAQQAATRQEYDRSQAAMKMSEAAVEAAGAAVREAEVNRSYSGITSPIAGRVVDRLADAGDMAAPGKPLMTIYDPSTLRIEVSVAEYLRPNVHLGDGVKVSIDTFEFEGEIEEIVPASDSSSRSFTARVSIPATEGVYPGMYGRCHLDLGTAEIILIPPEALKHVGQLEMVTVIKGEAARTRAVKSGKNYAEGVEILSGLQAGETIALP